MIVNIFEAITQETAATVKTAIDALKDGEPLELCILSCGGDAFAGLAISDMILELQSDTIAKVYGIAASAASLIALSCKRIEMASSACIMVHSAYTEDPSDSDRVAIDIINAAQLKIIQTRLPEFDIAALQGGDTWFTAEQAAKCGLIDNIINVGEVSATAGAYQLLLTNSSKLEEKTMDENQIENVPVEQADDNPLEAILKAIEELAKRVEALEQAKDSAPVEAEEKEPTEDAEICARMRKIYAHIAIPSADDVAPKASKKKKIDLHKFV